MAHRKQRLRPSSSAPPAAKAALGFAASLLLSSAINKTHALTINETIAANPNLSKFHQLDQLIDKGRLLGDPGTRKTAFVPTDAAFDALDADITAKLLSDEWGRHRINLVDHHLTGGSVYSWQLTDGLVFTTFNLEELEFTVTPSSVADSADPNIIRIMDGGATIIERDILASNGVVHVVDAVLTPFWTTLDVMKAAKLFPGTSTLATLLQSSGLDQKLLDDATPYTFFAPINIDQHIQSSDEMTAWFQDPDNVIAFLKHHIAPNNWYEDDLATVAAATGACGGGVTVSSAAAAATTTSGGDPANGGGGGSAGGGVISLLGASIKIEGALGDISVSGNAWVQETYVRNGLFVPIAGPISLPLATHILQGRGEQFSIMASLLKVAGLGSVLDALHSFTIAAPTNDAFQNMPMQLLTAFQHQPSYLYHLLDFLHRHIVLDQIIKTTELVANPALVTATAWNGESIAVSVGGDGGGNGAQINGIANIVVPNVPAFNPAIIQGIDSVLNPAWMGQTFIDVIDGLDELSQMAIFMKQFKPMLSDDGPFTIFAPLDAVFVGVQDQLLSHDELTAMLKLHVVRGMYVSQQIDAAEPMQVRSLSGHTVTLSKTISSESNGNGGVDETTTIVLNGVQVATMDLLANNGVVHIITGLLPLPDDTPSTTSPGAGVADVPTMAPDSTEEQTPPTTRSDPTDATPVAVPSEDPNAAPSSQLPEDTSSSADGEDSKDSGSGTQSQSSTESSASAWKVSRMAIAIAALGITSLVLI